ncbi:hypothetical protein [Algoriphagus sp.]|uniref:hypothetical protein n=1 Tax=Algoriphagus sp. TaxID=1872435 RepID=UPI00391A1487
MTNNEMNLLRKKVTLKYFLPLCLILVLGCSEDEKPNCPIDKTNGDPKSVLGTWQLVSRRFLVLETGKETTQDFSCDNIAYTFLENGNFVVKGFNPEMPMFSNLTYDFNYGEKLADFGNSTLRLSNFDHPCLVEKDKMVLNSTYVDGEILIFYRVAEVLD